MIKEINVKINGKFNMCNGNSIICFIVRGYLYENNLAIYDVFPVILFHDYQDKFKIMMLDLLVYTKSIICRDIDTFEKELDTICSAFERANIGPGGKCYVKVYCGNDVDIMMYNHIKHGGNIIQILMTDTIRNDIYEYIGRIDLEGDTVDMIYRVSSEGDDYPHDCKLRPDRVYHLTDIDTIPDLETYEKGRRIK